MSQNPDFRELRPRNAPFSVGSFGGLVLVRGSHAELSGNWWKQGRGRWNEAPVTSYCGVELRSPQKEAEEVLL